VKREGKRKGEIQVISREAINKEAELTKKGGGKVRKESASI